VVGDAVTVAVVVNADIAVVANADIVFAATRNTADAG
jgi:hypothetical protein